MNENDEIEIDLSRVFEIIKKHFKPFALIILAASNCGRFDHAVSDTEEIHSGSKADHCPEIQSGQPTDQLQRPSDITEAGEYLQ